MDIDLLLTRANACFDEREFQNAAQLYEEVLNQDPDNIEAAFNLGCVRLELGELDEAIACLKKVLDKPRAGLEAHLVLAKAYLIKKNFELSEFHSKIVLNADRYNVTALHIATVSCFNLGKISDATAFAERLVMLDGTNPTFHLMLAEIHESSGALDRMMAHLSRAVELDDGLDFVHKRIAAYQLKRAEMAQAISSYEKLFSHSPSEPILLNLYFCYLLDSKYDRALELLGDFYSNDDKMYRYLSAITLYMKGDHDGVGGLAGKYRIADLPVLDEYFDQHTAKNQQIISAAIENVQRIIDPRSFIFLARHYQVTQVKGSAENTGKEEEILVWGLSAGTRSLITLSRIAGFRPVGVVVEQGGNSEFEHLPVYSIHDVTRHDQLKNMPIVISGDGKVDGPASFREILTTLKQKHQVANRVLHSSFLIDFLEFPSNTHFALNGYMGSGNFIHYNLLNQILTDHDHAPNDPGMQLCQSLAHDYYQSLIDIFIGQFKPLGLESSESAVIFRNVFYGGWGRGTGEKKRNNPLVRIYGLPTRFYAMSRLHVTHEPLEPGTLDFYSDRGLRTLVFVRHPLDIIVSCSAKLNRPNPEVVINNPDWFSSMVEVLEKYFNNYVTLSDRITIFRYEDLLAEPRKSIIRLGKSVGRDISDTQADSLWQKFGFKSLDPRDPDHLWRPGANKWKKYLSPWHLELVNASNLMKLAKDLGYESELELDEIKPGDQTENFPYDYQLDDFTFYGGTGRRLVQPLPDNLFWMDAHGRAMVMSNREELIAKAREILESSLFRDIRASGFWEEEPRTLLNQDYSQQT